MANPPYVIVFPMPLQGHLNLFLWLSDYLVSSGLSVTFVYSARLFSLLSKNGSSSLASLSTTSNNPQVEVVPDGLLAEHNSNISRKQLLNSFPVMEKGLDDLMQKLAEEKGNPPSCIVTESFMPWTQNVADKHGIPRTELWTCSATSYAVLMAMLDLVDKGYLPPQPGTCMKTVELIPGMPPFPLGYFPKLFSPDNEDKTMFQHLRSFFVNNMKVDRVLLYALYDLESVVIDALRAQQIPVEPVGPFIPARGHASVLPEDGNCLDWLDAQQESSVLYVAFGSMAALDDETLQEIAFGLESSEPVHVLWVIRSDAVKGDLGDRLPEGFQSETLQARIRIISWAPQLTVLAHPAVSAFLTHCGWNSTMESLYMGVPMIGFPDGADQYTNLKCIIDWKVGMELEQQDKGGARCNREAVERVVRAMMVGEEGNEIRRQAREVSKAVKKATEDGTSTANLGKFVEDVKHGRVKRRGTP